MKLYPNINFKYIKSFKSYSENLGAIAHETFCNKTSTCENITNLWDNCEWMLGALRPYSLDPVSRNRACNSTGNREGEVWTLISWRCDDGNLDLLNIENASRVSISRPIPSTPPVSYFLTSVSVILPPCTHPQCLHSQRTHHGGQGQGPRIRALFRIILFSKWSQKLLFGVAEQWCGWVWEEF